MSRLPPWIRIKWATHGDYAKVHNLVSGLGLNTVCQDAKCPNIHECWNQGTATFMILGELCTRTCGFCAVKAGKPEVFDDDEPRRVVDAAMSMALRHVVVTSVARDDLTDGGASIFAETIRELKRRIPEATVEVLVPDFGGVDTSLRTVLEASPDVLNHNIETVRRLQSTIRPMASYGRSLHLLAASAARRPRVAVKSGIMLGLGEQEDEIVETLRDLRDAGCNLLTIGQYLAPSGRHVKVARYVPPEEFDRYARIAKDLGFDALASGPMVRSSYRAEDLLSTFRKKKRCVPACSEKP